MTRLLMQVLVDLINIKFKRLFFVSCLSILFFILAITFFVTSVFKYPVRPLNGLFVEEYEHRSFLYKDVSAIY